MAETSDNEWLELLYMHDYGGYMVWDREYGKSIYINIICRVGGRKCSRSSKRKLLNKTAHDQKRN